MRGYGQFCPVAKAATVVAERWTPLIVRELLYGSRRFNDIHRGVPLISRTLLATRLSELVEAGVIRHEAGRDGRGGEYRLTDEGEALRPVVEALGEWGTRFAQGAAREDDLDASLIMWDLRRKIRVQVTPPRRVVIYFELEGVPARDRRRARWWVVAAPDDVDLCLKDPGYDVDLAVTADLATLTRLWLWRLGWREAVRAGSVRVEGPRALAQALPTWLPVPATTPAGPPRFVIAATR